MFGHLQFLVRPQALSTLVVSEGSVSGVGPSFYRTVERPHAPCRSGVDTGPAALRLESPDDPSTRLTLSSSSAAAVRAQACRGPLALAVFPP